MDEQAREQAFVSALVTEHFVLQSARSTTVTEANGRAAIYLTSVSSALVAFGFVAQVANQLDPFMAAVVPALFVLGVFTFIRLVENRIENLVFLEQIQRIRGYYAGLVPEARAFFPSGTRMPPGSPAGAGVDGTEQGEMATALASTGIGASRVEMLFTAASMVGAVNSILGGVGIALLVGWAAGIDTAGAVLVGVVATLVVFGLHLVWESRRGDAALGWRAKGRRARGRRSDGCTPQVKGVDRLGAAPQRLGDFSDRPPGIDQVEDLAAELRWVARVFPCCAPVIGQHAESNNATPPNWGKTRPRTAAVPR